MTNFRGATGAAGDDRTAAGGASRSSGSGGGDDGGITVPVVSSKEMKELKRVYEKLCYNADKFRKIERLRSVRDRLAELRRPPEPTSLLLAGLSSSSSSSSRIGSGDGDGTGGGEGIRPGPGVRREVEALEAEEDELEAALREIRARPEQHIRPQDVAAALKELGRRVTKREVHDLMWEVDEKLDGVVDWEEFLLMFERNIRDTSGLEPAGFYHMVQFMIYDRDDNGMVSIDETMNMLYARLGREKMETTITKLFGGDDGAPIKEVGQQGGEIDFMRYWSVVEKEQVKMFNDSELGRNLAEKKRKKKADLNKKR